MSKKIDVEYMLKELLELPYDNPEVSVLKRKKIFEEKEHEIIEVMDLLEPINAFCLGMRVAWTREKLDELVIAKMQKNPLRKR